MSLNVAQLHGRAPQRATLLQRLTSATVEIAMVTAAFLVIGIPKAISSQLSYVVTFAFSPRVINPLLWIDLVVFRLLSPWHWRDLIFGGAGPFVLGQSDKNWASIKRPLLENASGKVLEVGSGSGLGLFYYNSKSVSHLYAMEPFEGLHGELKRSLRKASQPGLPGEGLESKCTIVPYGVQDYDHLASVGIKEASMDTVVVVQVLCSIENPRSHIGSLIKYLKPGGKLVMVRCCRRLSLRSHLTDSYVIHSSSTCGRRTRSRRRSSGSTRRSSGASWPMVVS